MASTTKLVGNGFSAAGQSHFPVIVVGGGQAGLSMSYCLKEREIDHVIFERRRMAESWISQRWDSFCLVTPNWQCQLPGFGYPGNDPYGFMKKEEIIQYVRAYAESFAPPIREGLGINRLYRSGSGFIAETDNGSSFTADQVVVATGGYHTPKIPRLAERLPLEILQLDSSKYRNPSSLPEGAILVVGSGQSGCQIAEDLHLEGRRVHLCVGGAPRTARFYRGKDVVEWLHEMGYYDLPFDEHPQKDRVRAKANHYVTGRDGGRDIDLRKFAVQGMQLYGRLLQVDGDRIRCADDLKTNLDQADAVAENIKTAIDQFIASRGIPAPTEERYQPLWEPAEPKPELNLREAGIKTIIWSMGFATDYRWIEVPIFDGKGYPAHHRGVTNIPGLYVLGLPWQYTWGSGRLLGVGRDAQFLADQICSLTTTPVL